MGSLKVKRVWVPGKRGRWKKSLAGLFLESPFLLCLGQVGDSENSTIIGESQTSVLALPLPYLSTLAPLISSSRLVIFKHRLYPQPINLLELKPIYPIVCRASLLAHLRSNLNVVSPTPECSLPQVSKGNFTFLSLTSKPWSYCNSSLSYIPTAPPINQFRFLYYKLHAGFNFFTTSMVPTLVPPPPLARITAMPSPNRPPSVLDHL